MTKKRYSRAIERHQVACRCGSMIGMVRTTSWTRIPVIRRAGADFLCTACGRQKRVTVIPGIMRPSRLRFTNLDREAI